MTKNYFSKNKNYESRIVLIDGFSGSGKILIAELLKAINNTEIVKLETIFDHLPIIYSFGEIEEFAAKAILKTIFDKAIYYTNIGREINLRRNDLTFALNHPNKFNYINAILRRPKEDNLIVNQVTPKQIFPFMVHMSTFNNSLFEKTFKNINIIYILRDPLFILETYSSYLDRINEDPREFTPKINFNGIDIPWYANNWAEQYLAVNNTEKSILLIEKCLDMLIEKLERTNYKNIYKILFFEDLVTKTDKKFYEIKSFLNEGHSKNYLDYIKKKNKVPRFKNQVIEGFWKRYTFNNERRHGENEEKIINRISKLVSSNYLKKLSALRDKYNNIKINYS